MILTLMWFASMTVVDATEKTMQGLKVTITIIVVEKKTGMHTKKNTTYAYINLKTLE